MAVWALSDLHLALGFKEKSMEVFGPLWKNYHQKIEKNWKERIAPSDLVLIPGDISWARTIEQALVDLNFLDALPGTKVLIKGNHDSWWSSQAKLEKIRPKTLHFIHNDSFFWEGIAVGGSRLWDTEAYSFEDFIEMKENPFASEKKEGKEKQEEDRKIFERELLRLERSLMTLNKNAKRRIAMTHYPPIGADLKPSEASQLLEKYHVDVCVFGHLHSVRKDALVFGKARGVQYLFCSGDYLDFVPIQIL